MPTNRMVTDCITCPAMCGNGAAIGSARPIINKHPPVTRSTQSQPAEGLCAGARTCVTDPIATGTAWQPAAGIRPTARRAIAVSEL